jgi:hypothetical protein
MNYFSLIFCCCLNRGMSPLHLLGAYGKENSSQILDLFKEHIRDYDLDQKDLKGNSGNEKKKTINAL